MNCIIRNFRNNTAKDKGRLQSKRYTMIDNSYIIHTSPEAQCRLLACVLFFVKGEILSPL